MSAQRLTVISAFAGGCLCTALFGFWNADSKPRAIAASERRASVFVAPLEAIPEAQPEIQPEPPPGSGDDGAAPRPEMGTSVADVLSRLETAYRIVAAANALDATTANETARELPVTPAPAREPIAEIVVPVATAEPVAPAAAPPSAPAASAELPPVNRVAASAPTSVTYVDERNTNIHVDEVQLGDRYQLEQLAVLQYLQLLALASYAGAPAPVPRQTLRKPSGPRFPITAIPNPDNPWGFNFPPPALVK